MSFFNLKESYRILSLVINSTCVFYSSDSKSAVSQFCCKLVVLVLCLLIHCIDETGNISPESGNHPFCLFQFALEFIDMLLGMFTLGRLEQANLHVALTWPRKKFVLFYWKFLHMFFTCGRDTGDLKEAGFYILTVCEQGWLIVQEFILHFTRPGCFVLQAAINCIYPKTLTVRYIIILSMFALFSSKIRLEVT